MDAKRTGRKFRPLNLVLSLSIALAAADAWASARVPRAYSERDITDVEVCEDSICQTLRQQILTEASRCRPLAKFKRGKVGLVYQSFNSCGLYAGRNFRTSKGACAAAVRAATRRAGFNSKVLRENAYNLQKKEALEKAGFVNFIWKYDEQTAPLGSILIYKGGSGHAYGHVEIRVNPHLYCSDHCSTRPVTAQPRVGKRYSLAGVYLPFTSSIQTDVAKR